MVRPLPAGCDGGAELHQAPGAGDDLLDGGAGADELFGSAGFDTASYAGSQAGVQVLLYAGSGLFGDAAGAVAGMVLAALSGRLIATFLFRVDPLDPLTFASVPAVILLTAIAAASAPAWRAARISPAEAFRER